MARPEIPSGIWKQIEGHLESETKLKASDTIEERGKKLLEAVKEGVKHVD